MSHQLVATAGRLVAAVSRERIEPYRRSATEADSEALATYAWNVALCEAFYPLLHHVEVLLRNALDRAGSAVFPATKCPNVPGSWLDHEPCVLSQFAKRDIQQMKNRVFARVPNKPTPKIRRHGDLVAEMQFGFWTGLLHTDYNFQSKREPRLWPHALREVFPYAPPEILAHVKHAGIRCNDIRIFRNRVFHYEPIFTRDLRAIRDEILAVTGWMSPESARIVASIDLVDEVSSAVYRRALRNHLFRVAR